MLTPRFVSARKSPDLVRCTGEARELPDLCCVAPALIAFERSDHAGLLAWICAVVVSGPFGSVSGLLRVRFGFVSGCWVGVGVGSGRDASVREKNIATLEILGVGVFSSRAFSLWMIWGFRLPRGMDRQHLSPNVTQKKPSATSSRESGQKLSHWRHVQSACFKGSRTSCDVIIILLPFF